MRRKALYFFLVSLMLLVFLCISEYKKIYSEDINSWSVDAQADCGVVLTGGAGRIREGYALLARKQIKKLVISGAHPDVDTKDVMPYFTLLGDVDVKDVIFESYSATTYGNAKQALPIVTALNCKDVLLVTSSSHMYRAYKTFVGSFPNRIPILKHAIVPSRAEVAWYEKMIEVAKSLFYSIWAY